MASSLSSFCSPWPDPKSTVLAKIRLDIPLSELFKWLVIRDTFLGLNHRTQDIVAALTLARDCKHPDAEWLLSVCKDVSSKQQAREVFLSHESDSRALCFAWLTTDENLRENDFSLVTRAAEMGNAFACASLCGRIWVGRRAEAFRMAQLAASQYERAGFYWLSFFSWHGIGCEKDVILAKETYLIAAELGDIFAATDYGSILNESDPARWIWWGRAALANYYFEFLRSFFLHVDQLVSGSGDATVVFLIGHALKGSIDVEKKEIFGPTLKFDSLVGSANQAVSFYESQCKAAHLALDTWTIISSRLKIPKDIRRLIGKMIWEARYEANYK